jgi:hypothetical protein
MVLSYLRWQYNLSGPHYEGRWRKVLRARAKRRIM